ncbi:MAG: glycosidase, partial [Nitrososphaeraceae archaeon]
MTIFKRYSKNPILTPNKDNWWESQAVFNCTAAYDGRNIHMLYRAIGEYDHYISRIGYASSTDGYNFTRRDNPAIFPTEEYET